MVKIALGHATGAISILSDGFHSLTDSASNVVGLVGVSVARRPPDENHPYGHRKYETMASLGILVFLIVVLVQVLGAAYDRLVNGGEHECSTKASASWRSRSSSICSSSRTRSARRGG